jgi:hypothetical protein
MNIKFSILVIYFSFMIFAQANSVPVLVKVGPKQLLEMNYNVKLLEFAGKVQLIIEHMKQGMESSYSITLFDRPENDFQGAGLVVMRTGGKIYDKNEIISVDFSIEEQKKILLYICKSQGASDECFYVDMPQLVELANSDDAEYVRLLWKAGYIEIQNNKSK